MWAKGRSLPGSPLNCTADNSKSETRKARRTGAKEFSKELLNSRHRCRGDTRGPEMLHAPGPSKLQPSCSTKLQHRTMIRFALAKLVTRCDAESAFWRNGANYEGG